ncbi:hypothetical protein ASPWEDRAFT_168005 [Aspergillus wentii DTO 134E9]|uniref:BZIP domain-containing protein n=1 Tax=Aspergillus wentii DTO 134E9 TaxID=1073089 RepID=A0A1L9RT12_ASPWE|nr:uncharacterized protein ASPWEDRAFT_168005 [Aspergillus wentii DTO 134E9]KAI9933732.1 hypothetical protein MW887_004804 [Aspergillus wentii]OJJ38072.1 hypothetical protein ASPWEDRAFT_168005 [Aspergillus wentii DTO 134E9]
MSANRQLLQTLSARSYHPTLNHHSATNDNEHIPDLSPDHDLSNMAPMAASDRVRKRGRPRLPPSNTAPSQDRRMQIRSAQRTYRLKKEAMFRDMSSRVVELESSMRRISDSLSGFCQMAVESDLHVTHPGLFKELHLITGQLQSETGNIEEPSRGSTESNERDLDSPVSRSIADPDAAIFGYHPEQVVMEADSHADVDDDIDLANKYSLNTPLPGTTVYTYSFHEPDFSRRLQRYCVEHAYRLFTNTSTNPQLIYRVFRLVPCIRDKTKMEPYFRRLVRAGKAERLEVSTLPFYCIGGAATHYPRADGDGKAVYPQNMRYPNRILGISSADECKKSVDIQARLEMLQLHGEWFDCHDVQGYLEERGVSLDGHSSLFPGISNGGILDVQCFFDLLVRGMVILGRAPGFRRSDVDAAFNSALRWHRQD